ncbi:MAG: nucleotidyltransferase domain-containing protein [Candidatus Hydrogenedentes bacterium]|nr:nucleotidyltransferase domain-containing protein [Candidatus Hydrogenedentota bacterium]
MKKDEVLETVRKVLSKRSEIAFGYVHGSVLTASLPSDVDVAVFLHLDAYARIREDEGIEMGFAIPLELELELALQYPAHLQVLNDAPLGFKFRVVQTGVVVAESDLGARVDFEYLSRVEYFDFRPKLDEYLKEAGS